MTEAAPGVLLLPAADTGRRAGSAGVPAFFTDVALRVPGPDGAAGRGEPPPGEPGEVLVAGPNVTAGYWGRPDATAAAFTADGWFRSGDLATRDAEGHHRIVDRLKDMYISGGENVHPAEVESVLHAHPAVRDAAVVGVPDARWGEVGVALVVSDEPDLDPEELRGFVAERLARYKVPATVHLVAEVPRNPTGKIDKRAVRDRVTIVGRPKTAE